MCGAKYIEGQAQPWECPNCGNLSYKNSVPTADIALFNNKGEVLLAKRGIEPNKGKYDLPGGFVEYGENAENAVKREIHEELGLSEADYSRADYCTSWNASYSFGLEEINTLSLLFTAKLNTDKITAQDDVEDVEFVAIKDLDSVDFSYPDYPRIIRKAYKLVFK